MDGTIDLPNNQEIELEEKKEYNHHAIGKMYLSCQQYQLNFLPPESTPAPVDGELQAENSRDAVLNENLVSESTQPSTRRRLEPGRIGKGKYEYQLSQERTVGIEIDERNVLEKRTRRNQRREGNKDATNHTSYVVYS